MLGHIYQEKLLWNNCNRAAKSKYNIVLARLILKQNYLPCIMDWTILNILGCAETIKEMIEIKVVEIGGNEEIFTYEAWRRAFDIREPIYTELCHEFFSTFEFDEVVTDEELTTKKLIKFRLGGRGHSLTLLEFARRLGLYTSAKICKDRFEVYFHEGLRNDDYFDANEYWVSISTEYQLCLSRSSTQTIRSRILRVLQKMIMYGLCKRTTGYDKIQRNVLWLMSMFEDKHQQRYANVAWLIAKWLKRKGVSTQKDMLRFTDLSDRIGRIKIQQGVLERMTRRQSYHSDRYTSVFEFMVVHYGVPLAGDYAPPDYDEHQQ
ncbi:hypothetical protein Tco_1499963 [Tanacetum coccineum]